jgi:surfactin family lipopeptide synthetase A
MRIPETRMQKEPRLSEAKQKLLEIQRRGGRIPTAATTSEVNRRVRESPAPLSLAQEQVWRLDQTAGKLAPLHNESITIHRHGPCDAAALEASLAEIVRRHEIWRMTFEAMAGQPVQIVHPAPATFKLPVTDLRTLPEGDREKKALELASHDARKRFDLNHGPLFRARLVTLDDAVHRLYLTAHQCIVDGITVFDIFPSELTTLYECFAAGESSPLPPLENQYADFADWQRRIVTGEAMEKQLAYWQMQLAGHLPILQWPNERARPAQQTFRGALHPFKLPQELMESLRDLGRREGATLFMILLAGLVALLHRYTRQEDIIVGTLSPSGRKQIEYQRLMGYFLNPVALRANLSGDPTFCSLLCQMREVTLGAISNDDVPLELIAERLQIKPDPSRHPFFTVALSVAPDVPQLPLGWSMTYMDAESGGARWDLYLEMNDRADGMIGRAQYNPDLFSNAAITQTLEDFRVLLERIVADPAERVSNLRS